VAEATGRLRAYLRVTGGILMPDAHHLYLFFVASLLLNLTPGNDMMYVASRSLSQGVRAGMISAIGVFVGCFVHILAAAVGLSIVVARSATLFGMIKFAGAGYLIFLGLSSILKKSRANGVLETLPPVPGWSLFGQGVITNALNPKVAIFFLSFLPQFVDVSSPLLRVQFLLLGLWFAVQSTVILLGVAFLCGRTSRFLKGRAGFRRIQERVTGVILVGLGLRLAFAERK
jgi:threonine/homoserine/homoserine lactone efflux protein